jgi:glutamine synthetase
LKSGSNACNYLLSCDITFDPIPNTKYANYQRGFGDFTMKADLNSFREINYINDHRQILVFADLYDEETNVPHAPRHLLRKAVNDLSQLGINVQVESDINFMIFQEKFKKIEDDIGSALPITEHHNLYHTLYKQNKDSFINKIKKSLKLSGINCNHISGAGSPGQYSLSLPLTDPLEFSDNVTLLKLVIMPNIVY